MILADGRRLVDVRVMTGFASSATGVADLPDPVLGSGGGDDPAAADRGEREMVAVIGFSPMGPVCFGFLFPHVSELMFKDRNRKVARHASDVYWTIDGKGNSEFFHPSGAYVRFGESGEHEDLTGKDFDGKWKIRRNMDSKVHIRVEQANGLASFDIDPSGNIKVKAAGRIDMESGVGMSFKAPRIDWN